LEISPIIETLKTDTYLPKKKEAELY